MRGKWFCCDDHAEKDPVAAEIIKEMEEEEIGSITEKVNEENAGDEEEKKELL